MEPTVMEHGQADYDPQKAWSLRCHWSEGDDIAVGVGDDDLHDARAEVAAPNE